MLWLGYPGVFLQFSWQPIREPCIFWVVYHHTNRRGYSVHIYDRWSKVFTCFGVNNIRSIFFLLQKCTDYRISEKRSFPTFGRTLAPTSKVSKSIIAVLNRYKWKRFTTIASTTIKWQETARTLIELAKRMNPPLIPNEICTYSPNFYNKSGVLDIANKKPSNKSSAFKQSFQRFEKTTAFAVRKELDQLIEKTKDSTRS